MRERIVSTIIVFLFGIGVVHGQNLGAKMEWKADPEAVKKLDKSVEVEGYTLRIPRNFSTVTPKDRNTLKSFKWVGPPRKEIGRPVFGLSKLTIPPQHIKEFKALSHEQIAMMAIKVEQTLHTNWKQDKFESGLVNGREFLRIRWSGNSIETKKDLRGFIYFTFEDEAVVYLVGQDNSSNADRTLPEIETALLTVQKKQ